MIKLIVTDIDGTLLTDSKELSPDFWEIADRLSQKGIIFSVASGRQYYNLVEQFDQIKDSVLFLAENGTYVKYQGKEIYTDALDQSAAKKFIEIARSIGGVYSILCGKNSAYTETTDEKFLQEARKYYQRLRVVDDLTTVNDIVLKVTFCHFEGSEKNIYPHFKPFENDYKVAVSGQIWLDINTLTANKGTAIRKIQESLGITFDETMVFGDFLNDLEMMQTAKYSYAMKNAHPEIIKASNFITEFDNNNHGVLEEIKKLV